MRSRLLSLFYQQIHEIFIDVFTLLFPVVADRFGDLAVGHSDGQINTRILFFLELATDSIAVTRRFIVVCQNGSSFTNREPVRGQIFPNILVDA